MKALLPIVVALGVWVVPSLGQTGSPTDQPKPPALPVIPPSSGNTVNFKPIPPQRIPPPQRIDPTQRRGPPQTRQRQQQPSGLGIFNAPSSNPWAVPPRQNPISPLSVPMGLPTGQSGMPWGPQGQPFPNQLSNSMQWLQMDYLLDRMDVPCGFSARRRRMLGAAIDHPEPFCECRLGGCDAILDRSGAADCGHNGFASCCCNGTPYNQYARAAIMRNNIFGHGRPMRGGFPGGMPGGMQGGMPGGGHPQRSGVRVGSMAGPVRVRQQTPTLRDYQMQWFR